ncbi:hypothetical protein OG563_18345 [Nocardia vinacea]|uniref:Uncharacterized protein n=1 Tax=Nocardia vinacea TaxID=96468 RepID=A0ABZ1Z382_9NOCA|nr:hypothetical protein [Nocardia vinacea]
MRSATGRTAEAEPRDLLDAVIGACPDGVADTTVAQRGYDIATPWSWREPEKVTATTA